MTRASFIGPVLLIGAGVLFLINNLRPELWTFRDVASWFPMLFVVWGAARLAEITLWWRSGKPLPRSGISGGEWGFIVLLCVLGTALMQANRVRVRFPGVHITGLELLGDRHGYEQAPVKMAAGKAPRVVIENFRGNARVSGTATEEISASGRSSIRAYTRDDADKANRAAALEIVRQGEAIVVRTNQDRVESPNEISGDIEITVPKGATITARGRYGDFDIENVDGDVTVDSENAGVRLQTIGGNVRVETRKSDIVRAVGVKGNVEFRGRGSDVVVENVAGTVVVNGEYYGDIRYRALAKAFRYESGVTELRGARLDGDLDLSRGRLNARDVTGPVYVKSRSKDVVLSGFTGALDLQLEKGDAELHPAKGQLGRMDVRLRGGNVEFAVPEGRKFDLTASTGRGNIEVEEGLRKDLRTEEAGKGRRATMSLGGPPVNLHTDRGEIEIRRAPATTAQRVESF